MKILGAFRIPRITVLSMSAVALFVVGWQLRGVSPRVPSVWNRSIEEPAAPQLLPFTFAEVVSYFAGEVPFVVQERRANEVVFRGGDNPENVYSIIVSSSGSELLVRFNVVDDYGMTLVRGFFDAPMFRRDESAQLNALLDGQNTTRALRLPRFDVIYEYKSPDCDAIISLIFSPRIRDANEKGGEHDEKN